MDAAEQLDVGSACSCAGERFLPRGRGCNEKCALWSQRAAPPEPWLSCPAACPGAHIHVNTHRLQPGWCKIKFGSKEIPLLAWIKLVPAVAQMRDGLWYEIIKPIEKQHLCLCKLGYPPGVPSQGTSGWRVTNTPNLLGGKRAHSPTPPLLCLYNTIWAWPYPVHSHPSPIHFHPFSTPWNWAGCPQSPQLSDTSLSQKL